MFNQNTRKLIGLALAVLILSATGYFIYNDTRNKKFPTSTGNSISSGIDGTGEAVVEQVPLSEGVLVPDLNRPLVFSTPDLTPEIKELYKKNIEKLTSSLKSDPKQIDKWLELGIWRKGAGDYVGAKQAWQYVAEVYPDHSVAYGNLGDLYHYYLKDYAKSEVYLKKALLLAPGTINNYRALYNLYTLSYKEKMPEALKVLSDGLVKNPNNYDLLVLTASYYKMTGDKANAKIYYEKALAVADKSGMAAAKPAIEEEIANLSK